MRRERVAPPAAARVLTALFEHFGGVTRIMRLALARCTKRGRRVAEDRVAVGVQHHGRPDDAPRVLIHELKLIENEQIREITTQGVSVPGSLGLDAVFRVGDFQDMARLILANGAVGNARSEGAFALEPEAINLLLRRHGVECVFRAKVATGTGSVPCNLVVFQLNF